MALILATDLVYLGSAGPLGEDETKVIVSKVVDILGPSVRWWSDVDFPAWSWEYGDFNVVISLQVRSLGTLMTVQWLALERG